VLATGVVRVGGDAERGRRVASVQTHDLRGFLGPVHIDAKLFVRLVVHADDVIPSVGEHIDVGLLDLVETRVIRLLDAERGQARAVELVALVAAAGLGDHPGPAGAVVDELDHAPDGEIARELQTRLVPVGDGEPCRIVLEIHTGFEDLTAVVDLGRDGHGIRARHGTATIGLVHVIAVARGIGPCAGVFAVELPVALEVGVVGHGAFLTRAE